MKKHAFLILLWVLWLDVDFSLLVYGNKTLKVIALITFAAIVASILYVVLNN